MFVTRRPFGALGVAALSVLALTTPALAQSDLIVTIDKTQAGAVTRTRAIDISDLSQATASGRAAIERRIASAAKQVCASGLFEAKWSADYKRCYSQAKSDAMRQASIVQTASLN